MKLSFSILRFFIDFFSFRQNPTTFAIALLFLMC